MSESVTKDDLQTAIDRAVQMILHEIGVRSAEANKHMERIDDSLAMQGKQLAAGARVIASFNEWVGQANAEYITVLAELAELKLRVQKLERPAA